MLSRSAQAALYYTRRRRLALTVLQKLTPWSSGLSVSAGDYVSSENGNTPWIATSSGTTGSNAPYGQQGFNDGGVTWTRVDIMSLLQFLYTGVPSPSSSPPFTPLSLTDLVSFWRADKGVSLSGSNVTAWADQEGGNNLTGASNPTYSATSFNSAYPGITLDGGYLYKNSTTLAATSTFSYFALAAELGSQGSGRFFGLVPTNGGYDYESTGGFAFNQGNGEGIEGQANGSQVGSYAVNLNTPILVGLVFTGSEMNLILNGTQVATTSYSGDIGASVAVNLGMGSQITNGGANGANTPDLVLAFAGITTAALTSTDWTNLIEWANSNWGTDL